MITNLNITKKQLKNIIMMHLVDNSLKDSNAPLYCHMDGFIGSRYNDNYDLSVNVAQAIHKIYFSLKNHHA